MTPCTFSWFSKVQPSIPGRLQDVFIWQPPHVSRSVHPVIAFGLDLKVGTYPPETVQGCGSPLVLRLGRLEAASLPYPWYPRCHNLKDCETWWEGDSPTKIRSWPSYSRSGSSSSRAESPLTRSSQVLSLAVVGVRSKTIVTDAVPRYWLYWYIPVYVYYRYTELLK